MSKYRRNGYEHPARRFRSAWEKFRKAWLAKKPLCAHCGRPGNHVDHIKPLHEIAPWQHITKRELLDINNCQTLCGPCHSSKSSRENTKKPPPRFCRCGHPHVNGRPICGEASCLASVDALDHGD